MISLISTLTVRLSFMPALRAGFFLHAEKNHRKKRQQIKKSADRDIISSAHWRDDKRCYVH
ncbi:hypothetical protein ACW2EO_004548, partial [Escherichia coli]